MLPKIFTQVGKFGNLGWLRFDRLGLNLGMVSAYEHSGPERCRRSGRRRKRREGGGDVISSDFPDFLHPDAIYRGLEVRLFISAVHTGNSALSRI